MAQDPLKFLRDRQGPARAPLLHDPKADTPQAPQTSARAPEPSSKAKEDATLPQSIQPTSRSTVSSTPASQPEGTGRLIVGPAIRVKGEIGACDTLVVQGEVEASMTGRVMEVAQGGLFKGQVELEEASVAGRVNGKLTVKGLLKVTAGGEVRGEIRYGELQIEKGGVIAGDIGLLDTPSKDSKPEAEATRKEAKSAAD